MRPIWTVLPVLCGVVLVGRDGQRDTGMRPMDSPTCPTWYSGIGRMHVSNGHCMSNCSTVVHMGMPTWDSGL